MYTYLIVLDMYGSYVDQYGVAVAYLPLIKPLAFKNSLRCFYN